MSQSSKQPISGLRSIKRDFSSNSVGTQDSGIGLTPTPPKHKLSGLEQRLKDIQDALNGANVSTEKVHENGPKTLSQKRPFQSSQPEPSHKRRQLPSSWDDPPSQPAYPTASAVRNANTSYGKSISVPRSETLKVPASSGSAGAKPVAVFLSPEQQHILKLVQAGNNVFYTGSAGTGKSVLLREIIKAMRKRFTTAPDAVAVTASTGIAACNIGGVTIHSFAGIGLGRETAEQLATKIRKNKKAMARWLRTKVLIIDEVSMVEGDLFDKLARIGCILRKRVEPFGAIQVIVTGDFFQLPPVMKGSDNTKFAFEAELWSQTIKHTFNLTQVFRQKDPEFVDMLNEMRFGQLSARSIEKFKRLSRDIIYADGLGGTELFPRREDVERSNVNRMINISSAEKIYTAIDSGQIQDVTQREKLLANFMSPKVLVLKIGAQVMLIKNIDETLVNGSMGKVVDFVDPADPTGVYETVDSKDGGKPASKGAPSKDGKKPNYMPVVEFLVPIGVRRFMVTHEVWKVELPNGEVQVSRTQLPLILSWAMSIHKSQGQTLERVKVDLAKVFEKGQAYVALSRATSLDGLQVLNFDPNKVKAHPKVVEWSRTLATVPIG